MCTRRCTLVGLAGLVGLTSGLGLVGCGFELRRAPELRFRTIQLTGFSPRSLLLDELRSSINATATTQVVENVAQAQVVLEAGDDAREKAVVASNSAGQVTEFQLRMRFTFKLRSLAGRELIPTSNLLLTRDLSYSESAALGKEQEEAVLYRTMQTDIVAQVMRRLAALQSF
jgi:LPS-assembly lipoprotein